jgi:hypothetical protein
MLLDSYIIAHELSRELLAGSETRDRLLSSAAWSFDRALGQVCYETQPNSEEIATFYGSVQLTREALDAIRRDLVSRRRHYLAARQQLTSEIACDAFALSSVVRLAMAQESQPSRDFYYYCGVLVLSNLLHVRSPSGNERARSIVRGVGYRK